MMMYFDSFDPCYAIFYTGRLYIDEQDWLGLYAEMYPPLIVLLAWSIMQEEAK